jgi:CheY-like chemotaxis protein
MIRVLITDDEALTRAGIRLILQNADEVRVVAEAQDAREAVEARRAHPVDVALLDIRMPGDGIAVLVPQFTRRLIESRTRPDHGSDTAACRIADLTPTELDVLRLLGRTGERPDVLT